jgi:hypothetical protein
MRIAFVPSVPAALNALSERTGSISRTLQLEKNRFGMTGEVVITRHLHQIGEEIVAYHTGTIRPKGSPEAYTLSPVEVGQIVPLIF